MAKILCVWEQGAELGHMSQLRLPVETAIGLGHHVYLSARHLSRAPEIFGDLPVTYLQAPFKQDVVNLDQSAFPSYTHLLARSCFSSVQELQMLLRAWRAIYDLIQPDVVLFEHSPTALIAASAYSFGKVLVGNGFTVPPMQMDHGAPFAPFINTPDTPEIRAALLQDDFEVIKLINLALVSVGATKLRTLHDIYAQADERFLMTWPELDHFGERVGQRYLGVDQPVNRTLPKWPVGEGERVFGYLHGVPGIETLLQDLTLRKVRALLVVRNLSESLKAQYSSEFVQFSDELLDLSAVAREAAWVINHGNHNTVAAFLRYGVPQLIVPMHQEHLLIGLRLLGRGCALVAYQDQSSYKKELLLMSSQELRNRAKAAALVCQDFPADETPSFIRQVFEKLASRRS